MPERPLKKVQMQDVQEPKSEAYIGNTSSDEILSATQRM